MPPSGYPTPTVTGCKYAQIRSSARTPVHATLSQSEMLHSEIERDRLFIWNNLHFCISWIFCFNGHIGGRQPDMTRHNTYCIISALIKSALFIPLAHPVPYWHSPGINSGDNFQ
jgi:hypothetical protein